MAEKKTVRTRNVAFRVTSEEYEQVEKLATEAGLDPNTWCRKVLVAALQEGSGLARLRSAHDLDVFGIDRERQYVGGAVDTHVCLVEFDHLRLADVEDRQFGRTAHAFGEQYRFCK